LVVCGIDAAVADVVLDCIVEEGGVLRDDANFLTETGKGDGANVLAVDEDAAGLDVIEAVQQP
jgi:hypothetical protein